MKFKYKYKRFNNPLYFIYIFNSSWNEKVAYKNEAYKKRQTNIEKNRVTANIIPIKQVYFEILAKIWCKWVDKLLENRIFNVYIRIIPKGIVDNYPAPDQLVGPKALDQTTNPLIAKLLSGSSNCVWYWVTPVCS